MDKRSLKRERGRAGEETALRYLQEKGAVILARNYTCRAGEIDIIAEIDHFIAFIEVKYRSTALYGTPAEAVDRRKQRRICKTALHYLSKCNTLERDVRFDVVEITPCGINHIESAFDYVQ